MVLFYWLNPHQRVLTRTPLQWFHVVHKNEFTKELFVMRGAGRAELD